MVQRHKQLFARARLEPGTRTQDNLGHTEIKVPVSVDGARGVAAEPQLDAVELLFKNLQKPAVLAHKHTNCFFARQLLAKPWEHEPRAALFFFPPLNDDSSIVRPLSHQHELTEAATRALRMQARPRFRPIGVMDFLRLFLRTRGRCRAT